MRAKTFTLHLDVADDAELRADPTEVGAQLVRPSLVDEAVERPEVGSQPSRRDPRLVHRLRIVVALVARVVSDKALVRVCERTPNDGGNSQRMCTHEITRRV